MPSLHSMIVSLLGKGMRVHRSLFRSLLSAGAVILVALSFPNAAQPETRQIKIVVPLPAGGAGDILARLLAEQVGHAHGAGIVVENRPGAGSVIGTEAVARAAPD